MPMLHPLFTLLIRKPELVVEHLAGYGALLHEEVSSAGAPWATRMAAWGVVAVMVLVFLILAGVAAMLGAVQHSTHWALFVVPGVALLAALVAFFIAKKPIPTNQFADIKAQVDADIQALRIAGEGK